MRQSGLSIVPVCASVVLLWCRYEPEWSLYSAGMRQSGPSIVPVRARVVPLECRYAPAWSFYSAGSRQSGPSIVPVSAKVVPLLSCRHICARANNTGTTAANRHYYKIRTPPHQSKPHLRQAIPQALCLLYIAGNRTGTAQPAI